MFFRVAVGNNLSVELPGLKHRIRTCSCGPSVRTLALFFLAKFRKFNRLASSLIGAGIC